MLDILSEVGMLGCRAANAPMKAIIKLLTDQGEILDDSGRYRWLVGKLNHLMVARPDIAFVVSIVSQFSQHQRRTHWDTVA